MQNKINTKRTLRKVEKETINILSLKYAQKIKKTKRKKESCFINHDPLMLLKAMSRVLRPPKQYGPQYLNMNHF